MNSKIKYLIAALGIGVVLMSFNTEDDKLLARAGYYNGVYIFVDCEPVNDYEVVGDVAVTFSSTSYNANKQSIVQKIKKKYKNEKYAILDMEGVKARVIRFK